MSKVKDFFKGWSKFELCWLVLSTVIMIVLSIIWGDNTLALISGITGILGVVLAAKGKVSTYFFATINVAIYAYLTFNNHLYGEFMLNAFYYIPMNFIGFYLWSRHKDEKSGEVEGKALTPKQIVKERIEGGANEKAVLRLFINCPFVCINFDFFWLNKARQLYMDF